MNLLQKVRQFLAIKAASRTTGVVFSGVSDYSVPSPDRDYGQLSDEGYQQCSEVYACINLIARTAKGIKWLVYQKPKTGKKLIEIEDYNHPLVKLIRKPNPYQG